MRGIDKVKFASYCTLDSLCGALMDDKKDVNNNFLIECNAVKTMAAGMATLLTVSTWMM